MDEGGSCESAVFFDEMDFADGSVTAEVILDVLLVPGFGEVAGVEGEGDGLAEILLEGSPGTRAALLDYFVSLGFLGHSIINIIIIIVCG